MFLHIIIINTVVIVLDFVLLWGKEFKFIIIKIRPHKQAFSTFSTLVYVQKYFLITFHHNAYEAFVRNNYVTLSYSFPLSFPAFTLVVFFLKLHYRPLLYTKFHFFFLQKYMTFWNWDPEFTQANFREENCSNCSGISETNSKVISVILKTLASLDLVSVSVLNKWKHLETNFLRNLRWNFRASCDRALIKGKRMVINHK